MSGRDDLDELHALAASISEDAKGWRAHRRQRAHTAAQAKVEAELVAPVKRRNRHRLVAAGVLGVIVLVGIGLIVVFWPKAHVAPHHRAVVTTITSPEVLAGRQAALQIASQGRIPDVFSCEGMYASAGSAASSASHSAAWRAGYLQACLRTGRGDAGDG
jgi:hypothetical protein